MVSVSFYRGADFIGLAKGKVTATASKEWTQEQDNSSSVAITATTTATDIIKGPASSALGVDHDYDVIWVWVNPMARLVVAPNSIQLATYAFNGKDNANEMEVIPLYVYWLKSPSTIPANVAARLARSWDTSGLGGLTAADYANILLADLFASASYNPNSDATGRFDLQAGQTFTYEPPPPGGQPITQQFSVQAQTTSTTGQSATSTYKTSFSIDFDTGADVIATLGADLKASSTYTTTDKWSSSVNRTTTKTASLSITGPATSDNYTGPTQFQVWRDNIYGSFMFYPVQ